MPTTAPLRRALVLLPLLLAAALLAAPQVDAQQPAPRRVGGPADPVASALAIARDGIPAGEAARVVIGRDDAFADDLAASALAGPDGAVLYTHGGGDQPLAEGVAEAVTRLLGDGGGCEPGGEPRVLVVGGEHAVSAQAYAELEALGHCTARLAGPSRVETALAVADAVPGASSTVLVARADDWADAATGGAFAARTRSRVLLTPTEGLHPAVAEWLATTDGVEQAVLLGGEVALSAQVADDLTAAGVAVDRVAGEARDGTAAAVADELWGDRAGAGVVLANGYREQAWTHLLAVAPVAARLGYPVLVVETEQVPPATAAHLDRVGAVEVVLAGPPSMVADTVLSGPSAPDLDAVRVRLEAIGTFDSPTAMVARPGTAELWLTQRGGQVLVLRPDGVEQVLDISATVSTSGERGLLGLAFSADGGTLYLSSTDTGGTSVLDAFTVTGGAVDEGSRWTLLRVAQPASNHNGGDLHLGPDGMLWWSLGDGGGANDQYGHGQRPDTLLGTLVRIAPTADGYAIPADNPWPDGQGGAPEVFAYGLRNPYRFSFDAVTGDLWIGDVGQGAVEEVDLLPATADGTAITGAGTNFGWSLYEGTEPFRGGSAEGLTFPVHEYRHGSGGVCSITGGVVYRGTAISALRGAYLYADFCAGELTGLVVDGGEAVGVRQLGASIPRPVAFATDHGGEVYVLSLQGVVSKLVPA